MLDTYMQGLIMTVKDFFGVMSVINNLFCVCVIVYLFNVSWQLSLSSLIFNSLYIYHMDIVVALLTTSKVCALSFCFLTFKRKMFLKSLFQHH